MPIRIRPGRASASGAATGAAQPDNRLDLMDEAFFAGHSAAGQKEVMHFAWVYDHAVDLDELRRVYRNLGDGLFGRRIERSPLPFGRSRWVAARETADIYVAERARPRAELTDWLDERSQIPVDPERGPGLHLGVLPLTDGGAVVTLVMSHYLLDGVGGVLTTIDAILDKKRDLGYPPPRSRTRLRALVQDAVETARETPKVGRAIVAAVEVARRSRQDAARSSAARPAVRRGGEAGAGGAELVIVPSATARVDAAAWDGRAQALGGTSNALAVGLTAKLGEYMGRRHDDGTVTVQVVVNQRTEGDTRAVAVSSTRVSIDPSQTTTDLRDARTAIKQALKTHRETPDPAAPLAPLTPFTSKRAWKRLIDMAINDPDPPAVCSNLGDIGPVLTRLDGTQAEWVYARGTRQQVTRRSLEQMGGQLQVLCMLAPALGKVCIHVLAYQLGAENTKPALRELLARTLAEFDLTAEID